MIMLFRPGIDLYTEEGTSIFYYAKEWRESTDLRVVYNYAVGAKESSQEWA
jgi:hypothetical protein